MPEATHSRQGLPARSWLAAPPLLQRFCQFCHLAGWLAGRRHTKFYPPMLPAFTEEQLEGLMASAPAPQLSLRPCCWQRALWAGGTRACSVELGVACKEFRVWGQRPSSAEPPALILPPLRLGQAPVLVTLAAHDVFVGSGATAERRARDILSNCEVGGVDTPVSVMVDNSGQLRHSGAVRC